MSKLRLKWLCGIASIEIVAIVGLLVWGLVLRQPAKPIPTATPAQTQTPQKEGVYNTPKIELKKVIGGLTKPIGIVAMPSASDKRLFIVEQTGLIRVIGADRALQQNPFLNITGKVKIGSELGLLGLAFHPDVAKNHYFYVDYTDKTQTTIIARYTISQDTGRADPATEKVLLKIKQPYPNHNGGNLVFGPDGYLYIGMGDGGSAGDPQNRAQNKNELLGKILRIDVNNGDPYAIPASNPFKKGDAKPEIWALGLRNPWRFSFDHKTGDLYIADVGQGKYEEIDFQAAASTGGENYGWRCYEGAQPYKTAGCQNKDTYVKPVLQYDHGDGRCSITGGFVYRGAAYPALGGNYFYGDYCNGQVFYATQTDGVWAGVLAAHTTFKISTFGQDSAGEMYVASYADGTIYQITDTAN